MAKSNLRVKRSIALVFITAALAATILFWPRGITKLLLDPVVIAGDLLGFTEQVSPGSQTNATEPYIAVDRSDGTIYVAWQATGSKVARSDDGGRSFIQLAENDPVFGRDLGDVAIRVGGPTPCATPMSNCLPGS